MIRKYYNHTLQTTPRHREEKPQITNSHKTSGRQLKYSNQLSLSHKMIAKLERHLVPNDKTRIKHGTHLNNCSKKITMNQQQQNHRLRTESSLDHWKCVCVGGGGGGLKAFTGTKCETYLSSLLVSAEACRLYSCFPKQCQNYCASRLNVTPVFCHLFLNGYLN